MLNTGVICVYWILNIGGIYVDIDIEDTNIVMDIDILTSLIQWCFIRMICTVTGKAYTVHIKMTS